MNELYQKLIDCADGRLSMGNFEEWFKQWRPSDKSLISEDDVDLSWTMEAMLTEFKVGYKSRQDCLDEIKVLAERYREVTT